MTEQEIEAIAARAAAATPAPWGIYVPEGESPRICNLILGEEIDCTLAYMADEAEGDNAPFMAAAPTDVPALIADLREANATIERVRELAFATPGRHADAPCTARCVIDLCLQIHAALVGSERGLASEAP